MKIYTKIIVNIADDRIVSCETFDYAGPLAQAISFGGNKSKSKQQSQSTNQSGTQFNEDFLNQALQYFGGKTKIPQAQSTFDSQRYLAENPDVAANWQGDPYQHYLLHGKAEGRAYPGDETTTTASSLIPEYNPQYIRGSYTPGQFTSVAPQGFQRLEDVLYGSGAAKENEAYNAAVNRQREELSQTGGLTSPTQYLEGSARSALDRSHLLSLEQTARDAAQARLAAETGEAGRRTEFDVGQGAARTAYDVGEAGRETGFNQQTAAANLERFFKLLQAAIDSGRYATGQSTGMQQSSGIGGQFSIGGGGSGGQMYGDIKNWMS